MKKETALERAKKIKRPTVLDNCTTDEMQDLSIAWVRGEITLTQMARALKIDNTGWRMYGQIANSLKRYLNEKHKRSVTNYKPINK